MCYVQLCIDSLASDSLPFATRPAMGPVQASGVFFCFFQICMLHQDKVEFRAFCVLRVQRVVPLLKGLRCPLLSFYSSIYCFTSKQGVNLARFSVLPIYLYGCIQWFYFARPVMYSVGLPAFRLSVCYTQCKCILAHDRVRWAVRLACWTSLSETRYFHVYRLLFKGRWGGIYRGRVLYDLLKLRARKQIARGWWSRKGFYILLVGMSLLRGPAMQVYT